MRKKVIALLLVLSVMSIMIAGCGGKPQKMDDETYSIGKQALAVEERIRNESLDKHEGMDQLFALEDDLHEIYNTLDLDESILNNSVSIAINGFCIALSGGKNTTEQYDELKKLLGE